MLCTFIYKTHVIDLWKFNYENDTEFEMRKWYIFKNLFQTHEYADNENMKRMYLDELVNYSKIHIQKEVYGCKFNEFIMINSTISTC